MPGWVEEYGWLIYPVEDVDRFDPGSLRPHEIEGVKGVSQITGQHLASCRRQGESDDSVHLQAWKFSARDWTLDTAKQWLESHRATQLYTFPLISAVGDPLRMMKTEGARRWRVGELGIIFGTPKDLDSYGTFFSKRTNLGPRQGDGVASFFQHTRAIHEKLAGLAEYEFPPVHTELTDRGLFVSTVLDMANEYEEWVADMAAERKLRWSSATAPHIMRVDWDTGEILRWHPIEFTFTPTAAEWRLPPLMPQPVLIEGASRCAQVLIDGWADRVGRRSREAERSAALHLDTEKGKNMAENQDLVTKALEDLKGAQSKDRELLEQISARAVEWRTEASALRAEIAALKGQGSERSKELADQLAPLQTKLGMIEDALKTDPGSGKGNKQSDACLRAWERWMRTGNEGTELSALRTALAEGSSSAGGYDVPDARGTELIKELTDGNFVKAAGARVVPLGKGKKVIQLKINASGMAQITSEAQDADEDEPTYDIVEGTVYDFTRVSKVSQNLLDDADHDVYTEVLAPDFANAFNLAENYYQIGGTNSSMPQGVNYGATVGVTAASTSAVTADELMEFIHSVDPKYRAMPDFCVAMRDATYLTLRKLKNATTGDYVFNENNLRQGGPITLLGVPVKIWSNMPAIAASAKIMVAGSMRYFWIWDRKSLMIDRNPYLYQLKRQVAFFGWMRWTSAIMMDSAFRSLQMHA